MDSRHIRVSSVPSEGYAVQVLIKTLVIFRFLYPIQNLEFILAFTTKSHQRARMCNSDEMSKYIEAGATRDHIYKWNISFQIVTVLKTQPLKSVQ